MMVNIPKELYKGGTGKIFKYIAIACPFYYIQFEDATETGSVEC